MSSETGKRKPFGFLLNAIPLVLFLAFAYQAYILLNMDSRNTQTLPSALLDKPAPQIALSPLEGVELPGISPELFNGKISVVNVFGSWCIPCREEHPQIMRMGEINGVQMVGINQRDTPTNATTFLLELGNPYDAIGVDPRGRASIEWGVYGVPETFFVDASGTIRHKHVGPISERDLEETIKPLIERLRSNAAS